MIQGSQRNPLPVGVKSGRVVSGPAEPFQGPRSRMSRALPPPPVVCGWVAPFFSAGAGEVHLPLTLWDSANASPPTPAGRGEHRRRTTRSIGGRQWRRQLLPSASERASGLLEQRGVSERLLHQPALQAGQRRLGRGEWLAQGHAVCWGQIVARGSHTVSLFKKTNTRPGRLHPAQGRESHCVLLLGTVTPGSRTWRCFVWPKYQSLTQKGSQQTVTVRMRTGWQWKQVRSCPPSREQDGPLAAPAGGCSR